VFQQKHLTRRIYLSEYAIESLELLIFSFITIKIIQRTVKKGDAVRKNALTRFLYLCIEYVYDETVPPALRIRSPCHPTNRDAC
jgi:hypothetical protein